MSDDEIETGSDNDILEEAKERLQQCQEADRDNRRNAAEDMRFAIGEQWPAEWKRQREAEDRPALTINRVQQMVKQVVNDMRQNRPAIKVHPVDSGADVAVADILSGIIRHIETSSNASDAYDTAAECAVTMGTGYIRILTEYEGDGFDQCILIKRVRNPFTVFYDPMASNADGSDARFALVIDDIPREEFKSSYPDCKEVDYETDVDKPDWITEETIRIAEYFAIEEETDTLYLLADGTIAKRSDMPAPPPKLEIKKQRELIAKKVMWYKLTGVEILDRKEWPGQYIPIIPVYGEEHDIEGEVIRFGIVRHARDPQQIYNYSRTSAVEQVALAPKSPYIIAEGQVEGYEDLWETANSVSHAYLPYKPTTVAGTQVAMPQRQAFTGVPVGAISDLQLAAEEIKAVTGIYDASLGNRSNETSGVAINARNKQADNATFHYTDNQGRSIRFVGRQLVDMIPRVYDTPRVARIVGIDGAEEMKQINTPDPMTGQIINPLDVGRYDVTVDVGPSYQTRRIEAADSMIHFLQAYPPAAQVIGDLVAKAMDWPDSEAIAKRLKVMLPPQILQADQEDQQVPPHLAAKMQEQMQVIQGLQQAMQQAQGQLQQAQQEQQAKESELQIKAAELQLKGREVGVKETEVQIKAGELQLKARDQDMEAMRLQFEAQQPETSEPQEPQQQIQPIIINQPDNIGPAIQALSSQISIEMQKMHESMGNMMDAQQTVAIKPVRGPDGKLLGGVQVKADGSEVQIQIQ